MVERCLGNVRYLSLCCRGKNVAFASSSSVCVLEHLRPDLGEAARDDVVVDFLIGDESIHAQVWDQGGGDCKRCGEEQGKRGGSSLCSAGRQNYCRGCHELRAYLLAGETVGRESSQRRRGCSRACFRESCQETDRSTCLAGRCRLDP